MSLLSRLVLGILLVLFAVSPAAAVQPSGSAAWTDVPATLYSSSGWNSHAIGSIDAGLRIRVDRCHILWCQIHAGHLHGWMPIYDISFGQHPWRLFGWTHYTGTHKVW